MHVRVEKCPHCGKMIDFDIRPGGPWNSKLGEKTIYHCPKCRGAISDGMMEWSEMARHHRVDEIAWWSLLILAFAPVFGGMCAYAIIWVARELFGADIPVDTPVGISAAAFSLWALIFFIKEIRNSLRRSPNKGLSPSNPKHPDHQLWANREGPYSND